MKYSANDIARILNASEIIDTLEEPSIEQIYEKAKHIIELLSEILPSTISACHYKNIEITSNLTIGLRLFKTDYKNGHTYGFAFHSPSGSCLSNDNIVAWDGEEHYNMPARSSEYMKSKWYALLLNKDSVIEQAIKVRQTINAEKVARIRFVNN